jgi:salicylate hydroxylase
MAPNAVHVGIVGAGMGGLAAAIALRRGGVKVTILEATNELGEIGAGIQIFSNISKYLIRWGVDEIIGDNLVRVDEVRTWGVNGEVVTRVDTKRVHRLTGFPHLIARRDHLHAGLSESARRHGVEFLLGARVDQLQYTERSATVTTTAGKSYTFDLVVGCDGIKSTIRQHLFPSVKARAPSKVAAYRGILSYDEIREKAPEAASILTNTMDMWTGPQGYIMTYPLSGGKELNVVTSFCKSDFVAQMEEVDIDEFRGYYKDYSPAVQSIIKLVNYTQRWPLLVMPPMARWSNKHRNVVLLGDAAHAMQNHVGQGAATAIEDGVFLGRALSEVVRGAITVPDAVTIYERKRIPRAWTKQQVSLVSGELNMSSDPADLEKRDISSLPEVAGAKNGELKGAFPPLPPEYRSWQMFDSPESVPGIFYYDAEGDADNAVCEFLQERDQANGEVDELTMVSKALSKKWWSAVDFNGITSTAEVLETRKPRL